MRGSYSGNTSAFQAEAVSSILIPRSKFSECRIVWLFRLLWEQEIASSNLATRTIIERSAELAQWESISFTPRGSGVRNPDSAPYKEKR